MSAPTIEIGSWWRPRDARRRQALVLVTRVLTPCGTSCSGGSSCPRTRHYGGEHVLHDTVWVRRRRYYSSHRSISSAQLLTSYERIAPPAEKK